MERIENDGVWPPFVEQGGGMDGWMLQLDSILRLFSLICVVYTRYTHREYTGRG